VPGEEDDQDDDAGKGPGPAGLNADALGELAEPDEGDDASLDEGLLDVLGVDPEGAEFVDDDEGQEEEQRIEWLTRRLEVRTFGVVELTGEWGFFCFF